MKNIITICLFILCAAIELKAQQYNQTTQFRKANSQWAFGKKAGLDFSSGSPVPVLTNYGVPTSWEGGASVANPRTGVMAFYSSGYNCKDRNGNVMPNGAGLLGNDSSTTQGVCIVPFVDDSTKYYLFSLSGPTDRPRPQGTLYYSVVDMTMNGGLGDIDPTRKNILVHRNNAATGFLGEAMIAVPGNNCDVWLLVHQVQKSLVNAYHITASGVDTNQIISSTGTLTHQDAYRSGGMAVSPNRRMLAIANRGNGISVSACSNNLARFDPNTGMASNGLELSTVAQSSYTCAFSPDNSRVYFSCIAVTNAPAFANNDLSQYTIDTNNWTVANISSSRVLIAQASTYLRLYGDTIYASNTFTLNGNRVNIIANPNLAGTACNFIPGAITLLPGTNTRSMLPNEVVFANCGVAPPVPPIVTIDTIPGKVADTARCRIEGVFPTMVLTAKAGSKYVWDDGSMQQTRTISNTGIYWVRYHVNDSVVTTDSFRVQEASPLPSFSLGLDVVICEGKSKLLAAPVGNYSYHWQDNSTNQTFNAQSKGTYFVTISQNGCTAADTVLVDTKNCSCGAGMPSAFTPNNDGRNDRIVPLFGKNCLPLSGYTFRIFNRWGQLVYVSYSLNDKGWDGMFNGQLADVGTYFYELNYHVTNLNENRHQTGDVTLVR